MKSYYGSALSPEQREKLKQLQIQLNREQSKESWDEFVKNRARNNRLRSHNERRHLIATGVIKEISNA